MTLAQFELSKTRLLGKNLFIQMYKIIHMYKIPLSGLKFKLK
jgi:hypothetical protein